MTDVSRSPSESISIAMVGTRGVPAKYGGFETCIEEVGRRLADRGHEVIVYCRRPTNGEPIPKQYLGMRLVELPALRRRSLETLSHTALSVAHLMRHKVDAAIVFNCANAPFLPALRARKIPFATHVDGLEWKRAKWGPTGQRYYKFAEKLSVRWSDALIADARGIGQYYEETYAAATDLIAYGAPIVSPKADLLETVGLNQDAFHLVVARFEPENHVEDIVRAYCASAAELPLVVVGSAPYSDDYTARVRGAADGRVKFLGGVWDQDLLDQLYGNARTYLHGHSVGGTNPSLLRAIGAGAATTAFDVTFNREVLGESGRFFSGVNDLTQLIEDSECDVPAVRRRAAQARREAARYDWDSVADQYENLCMRLANGKPPIGRTRVPAGIQTLRVEDGSK